MYVCMNVYMYAYIYIYTHTLYIYIYTSYKDSYFVVEDIGATFGVNLGGTERIALYGEPSVLSIS